jgi:hypothetical protein
MFQITVRKLADLRFHVIIAATMRTAAFWQRDAVWSGRNVQTFQRNLLPPSKELKDTGNVPALQEDEGKRLLKIRVGPCQITRSHTLEETSLHRRHRGNIKSTFKGTDWIHHDQNLCVLHRRSPVNTNPAEGYT